MSRLKTTACEKPFIGPRGAYGCGQCTPCRINRRRVWTHRIMLEAVQHAENAFVTLTYTDDKLPTDLSVSPREISLFAKRLRKTRGRQTRYFAVGEYGDTTGRPHYHLAMFGQPQCLRGRTDLTRKSCCPICDEIHKTWGQGAIEVAQLDEGSARYVARYVTKKWTRGDAPGLEGRLPEFARMSLRPAIGLTALNEIASIILEQESNGAIYVDVPIALAFGTKQFPLGRYLRRQLRARIGRDLNTPEAVIEAIEKPLQVMRVAAHQGQGGLEEKILEASLGRRQRIESKQSRQKKGRI